MTAEKFQFSGTGCRFFLAVAFPVFALVMLFSSCATVGTVAQVGAGLGVISENTANAVSASAEAFGKALEEITPEQEYYIGRAVGATVLGTYKLQTNTPAMTAYINRICSALVINSDKPEIYNGYHASILDSDEINAFATPGGHIFITRGLIGCATSEDTLASVIAHELAHIQLQHGLKAIKNSRFTQAILVTGTSVTGAVAQNMDISELVNTFNDTVNDIVTTMVTNGYSRTQEFDADNTAMKIMAQAGYEPSSLVDMLRVLERNQSGRSGGFNNTHPGPAQRIANVQKNVNTYNVTDTRSYRQARYSTVR